MDSELKHKVHVLVCNLLNLDDEDHEDDDEARPLEDVILALVAASNKALLLRVRELMPELKTLKTDTALDDEDGEKFCVECGQYEFEGYLKCRCYGFNEAVTQALAVIDAEIEGL